MIIFMREILKKKGWCPTREHSSYYNVAVSVPHSLHMFSYFLFLGVSFQKARGPSTYNVFLAGLQKWCTTSTRKVDLLKT